MALNHHYSQLTLDTVDEDEESLELPAEKFKDSEQVHICHKCRRPIWPWAAALTLLCVTALLVSAAITRSPNEAECMQKLSVWSPAFEAVEYVDVQFQNGFFEQSKYRGRPTPEIEKAWFELWNFGPVNIPVDKLSVLNKSKDDDWQRTKPESGGGVIGSLEVFHQIHCLDLIRQYTYKDEYDYSNLPSFDGSPRLVREHVDHCINSLRIYLQCASDVTPYLMKRDTQKPLGIDPDFNTQHKCRNFDAIHAWTKMHELQTDDYQKNIE